MNILICKSCVTPSSRPRVYFNDEGICNACTSAEEKKKIDWEKRKKEFLVLVEDIKKYSKNNNNNYDCIIPWSGGKDSTSIALKLKNEFDLNPLLVTFSPLITNKCGQHNREELLKLGFDSIFFRPNQKVAKLLAKRFFIERGNPKVGWEAGINSIPIKTAINYNIPFVFYAEHGESEYGGLVLSEESKKKRDITEVIEHQIGDDPNNWQNEDINLKDLEPYIYPTQKKLSENKITAYYFSYFFRWSMFENYKYVKKIMPNFQENPDGRTNGTFTDFDSLDDSGFNLVIGDILAFQLGVGIGDFINVLVPDTGMGIAGIFPRTKKFKISAIFSVGAPELDQSFAFMSIKNASKLLKL